MDWRNRIGLYGAYFFGMCGIGFTLPYLPLYLRQQGLSDAAIGEVSTLAALAGLVAHDTPRRTSGRGGGGAVTCGAGPLTTGI